MSALVAAIYARKSTEQRPLADRVSAAFTTFGLVATLFRKSFGHLSLPHCAEKPPDDNGRFLTTMTDGRGACLSG